MADRKMRSSFISPRDHHTRLRSRWMSFFSGGPLISAIQPHAISTSSVTRIGREVQHILWRLKYSSNPYWRHLYGRTSSYGSTRTSPGTHLLQYPGTWIFLRALGFHLLLRDSLPTSTVDQWRTAVQCHTCANACERVFKSDNAVSVLDTRPVHLWRANIRYVLALPLPKYTELYQLNCQKSEYKEF